MLRALLDICVKEYVDNVCKAMKQRSQQLRAASVDHAASVATHAASVSQTDAVLRKLGQKTLCAMA